MSDAKRAAEHLRGWMGTASPSLAVVLGSGLGGISESLEERKTIPFTEIPGFPSAGVAGHAGFLHSGIWGGRPVLLFQGRVHLYEGHPLRTVTLPARTAAELGVSRLVLTNAAGSCDREMSPGTLMRASDLIDLFFRRLREGMASPRIGAAPLLDPALGELLDRAACLSGVELRTGALCGSSGPSYETAAEIRLWRRLGARAACMSTIPEAFAARRAGVRVAAISLITNYGTGIAGRPLSHEEVVEWAAVAGERLARLLRKAVEMDG